MRRIQPVWILFAAAIFLLVRLELHSDDAGVIAFLILLSTFLLTYLEPRRVRLWALTGWTVPAAALVTGQSIPDLHRIPGILILLAFTDRKSTRLNSSHL